jgi:2-amino-4-hydroxy-6-hydroxymethyldihydropteridine diphosphokinase
MSRARAYVGLGSNLDQPARQVRQALAALAALPGTQLAGQSRLYRTPPWGDTDQPAFVNAVAALDTKLTPGQLLEQLQRIEAAAGRARERRWGPRILDLDLLLHGDSVLDRPGLQLPHPQLPLRAFVLVPLAELAPDLIVPGQGRVRALLGAVDTAGIEALR